jgi:acetyl esterase/lipase
MSCCASTRVYRPVPVPIQKTKPIDKIIIHLHGGGFIGMSSGSH